MPAAYLSGTVFRRERPILLVLHEEDGDWQFLDGQPFDEDDALALHVEHVFEQHLDVRPLADLPAGWAAERTAADASWRRYPWVTEHAADQAGGV